MGTSHEVISSDDAPLGQQLANRRRTRGLSQRELAARSGVNQADISRIERGTLSPTTTTLDKLAHALGSRVRIEPNASVAPPGSRYEDQRPYAIVQQLDELRGPTSGTVELDRRLEWSGRITYDLANRRRLISMYETVLREASRPDELARWIDGNTLRELWPDLVLPPRLRTLWEERFSELANPRRRPAA